jgi:CheY-like chemotaxis protein
VGTVAEPAARILVVDDEENVLDLVASVLRFAGYEVETAETGWLGLQAARRSSFDLVVLDVMLPDMTGFEVCPASQCPGDRAGALPHRPHRRPGRDGGSQDRRRRLCAQAVRRR